MRTLERVRDVPKKGGPLRLRPRRPSRRRRRCWPSRTATPGARLRYSIEPGSPWPNRTPRWPRSCRRCHRRQRLTAWRLLRLLSAPWPNRTPRQLRLATCLWWSRCLPGCCGRRGRFRRFTQAETRTQATCLWRRLCCLAACPGRGRLAAWRLLRLATCLWRRLCCLPRAMAPRLGLRAHGGLLSYHRMIRMISRTGPQESLASKPRGATRKVQSLTL